jgi:hypothetical protein
MVERVREVLRREEALLAAFKRYLPYEKGFVISRTERYLSELVGVPESFIGEFYPDFASLSPVQRAHLLRYLAFLISLSDYERELKKLEYEEKSPLLAQLKDKRLLNVAMALKKEGRRGRRPKKRAKLEKLKGELLMLRREGLGADLMCKYLWKTHRLKVSKPYLLKILKEWSREEGRGNYASEQLFSL